MDENARDLDNTSSLSKVLKAAEGTATQAVAAIAGSPADYAKSMPPQPGTPVQSTQAHYNISGYGESYAKYLEQSGDEILAAAQAQRDDCYALADLVRGEYKAMTGRVASFFEDIQRRALALEAARRGGETA